MSALPQTPPATSPLAVVLDTLGATADAWTVDPATSTFELRGRYVFGPAVTARFAVVSGHVEISPDRSDIAGNLLLDAGSLSSGIGLRDQHVRERRSALDVDRYPTIRFDLDRTVSGSEATFDISGRVTIRDITRPVQLRVDARLDGDRAELTVTGDVEHRPFKLGIPALSRQLRVHACLRAIPDPSQRSLENP